MRPRWLRNWGCLAKNLISQNQLMTFDTDVASWVCFSSYFFLFSMILIDKRSDGQVWPWDPILQVFLTSTKLTTLNRELATLDHVSPISFVPETGQLYQLYQFYIADDTWQGAGHLGPRLSNSFVPGKGRLPGSPISTVCDHSIDEFSIILHKWFMIASLAIVFLE